VQKVIIGYAIRTGLVKILEQRKTAKRLYLHQNFAEFKHHSQ